jgi:hypothetical protein
MRSFAFNGEGGIRTHGAHHTAVFKTAAINHSATSPEKPTQLVGLSQFIH